MTHPPAMWPHGSWYGIIVETGVYGCHRDIKVLWSNGEIETSKSRGLEVINDN